MPREPERLLQAIRDGSPVGGLGSLSQISSLLGRGDADRALRAALFHAAALLPNIELGGVVRDRLGRVGEEITLQTEGVVTRLIIEPDSSLLLGDETVTREGPAQGIASWRAYMAWSRVNTIGERPTRSPKTD